MILFRFYTEVQFMLGTGWLCLCHSCLFSEPSSTIFGFGPKHPYYPLTLYNHALAHKSVQISMLSFLRRMLGPPPRLLFPPCRRKMEQLAAQTLSSTDKHMWKKWTNYQRYLRFPLQDIKSIVPESSFGASTHGQCSGILSLSCRRALHST